MSGAASGHRRSLMPISPRTISPLTMLRPPHSHHALGSHVTAQCSRCRRGAAWRDYRRSVEQDASREPRLTALRRALDLDAQPDAFVCNECEETSRRLNRFFDWSLHPGFFEVRWRMLPWHLKLCGFPMYFVAALWETLAFTNEVFGMPPPGVDSRYNDPGWVIYDPETGEILRNNPLAGDPRYGYMPLRRPEPGYHTLPPARGSDSDGSGMT